MVEHLETEKVKNARERLEKLKKELGIWSRNKMNICITATPSFSDVSVFQIVIPLDGNDVTQVRPVCDMNGILIEEIPCILE